MKRKISAVLVAVMLFTTLFSIGATAATPVTTEQSYTHDFNVDASLFVAQQGGSNVSLSAAKAHNKGTSGSALKLKITSGTNPYVRNTQWFTPLETNIIPVGTYTFSIWVKTCLSSDWQSKFVNGTANGTYNVDSELGLALYEIGAANGTLASGDYAKIDKAYKVIKLFHNDGEDAVDVFSKTDETYTDSDSGTDYKWTKWSATVELTQPVEKMSFWTWSGETVASNRTQWETYVDDLSIVGTPAQQAEGITLRGVQETAAADTFNARLVSTVDGLDDKYQAVGYDVSLSGDVSKPQKTVVCEYAYDKLLGSTETGVTLEYSALDYNASYIVALTLTDLPAVDNLIITVTPFVIDKDGQRDTANEKTYTITYAAGVFQSIALA